ncbi:MAG: SRPBCC family protein [Polyangiaceae bacterium]
MLIAVMLSGSTARPDTLSYRESDRLLHGETVVRPQLLRRGERRYVGGVAYAIVDASPEDLEMLLSKPEVWRRLLPRTRSARRVGGRDADMLLEITQGTAFLRTTYTIRFHRDGDSVRFWIDGSRPHDIEDAWGFVRAEPLAPGRALVTYGVLIDLGPGLLRALFEDGIRDAALSLPDRIRNLVVDQIAAGQRAAVIP